MKKILGIVVLGLLLSGCETYYIDRLEGGLNHYLQKGYKITNERFIHSGNYQKTEYTLKHESNNTIVMCMVYHSGDGPTKCRAP